MNTVRLHTFFYYDFNKTISDKNKDIQSLHAQIVALEGVATAEARAQKAQLEAELAESQEDLDDTLYEHEIELSQDALDSLSETLDDNFEKYWTDLSSDLDKITELMNSANQITADSADAVVETLNQLLTYYGIDPVVTGISDATGYASGTMSAPRTEIAEVNEDGHEIYVSPSGKVYTLVEEGAGIIPADLTQNLMKWGTMSPNDLNTLSPFKMPDFEIQSGFGDVNIHYDSLLTVNGDVSKDILPDLQTILQKSYDYTVKEIVRDAQKVGIRTR